MVYITIVTEASQREEMTFKMGRRKFSFISDSSLLSICSVFSFSCPYFYILLLCQLLHTFNFLFLVVNECKAYNALEIHFINLI